MYGKIFESIFKSTLVAEGGWLPTYIFMSMITLADKNSIVDFAPKALYSHLGFKEGGMCVDYDLFLEAIKYLEKEDSESNSQAENGKRIVPLSEIDEIEGNRGWFVVNAEDYRKLASKHDERESTADRVRRYRERQKRCNGTVTDCNATERNDNGKEGHTDTDKDNILSSSDDTPPYKEIVSYLNLKANKSYRPKSKKTRSVIKARWNEGYRLKDFRAVIDVKSDKWKNDIKMEQYLRPETLFGNKFEGYLNELPACGYIEESAGC